MKDVVLFAASVYPLKQDVERLLRQNRHIGNRADYAANRQGRIVGKRIPVAA